MNILAIYYKDKKGGFNRRLYQALNAMVNEGHSIYFIGSEKIPLAEQRIYQNIIHAPFIKNENIIYWLSFILTAILKTFYVARKSHIDRIVTFGPFYTLLCFMPILLLRMPAITFVRADNMKHSKNNVRNLFFYFIDWAGIKLSRQILFVSNTLKKEYRRRYHIPDMKSHVIPNNIERHYQIRSEEKIEIRRLFGVSVKTILIATSCVLNRGKNIDFLINAIRELRNENIKALIIGDEMVPNGERARLEGIARKAGLEQQIIFTGWQTDPLYFIAGSDLFVFPSKFEGSPNALLEALGCGVPCLGSRITEIKEVLGFNELMFSLSDPRELVTKLRRVIEDTGYLQFLTDLCKERAGNYTFNWENAAVHHMLH